MKKPSSKYGKWSCGDILRARWGCNCCTFCWGGVPTSSCHGGGVGTNRRETESRNNRDGTWKGKEDKLLFWRVRFVFCLWGLVGFVCFVWFFDLLCTGTVLRCLCCQCCRKLSKEKLLNVGLDTWRTQLIWMNVTPVLSVSRLKGLIFHVCGRSYTAKCKSCAE